MESTVSKHVEITLTLTLEEAEWLKGWTQNPLYENEREEDSNMREKFFHAIDDSIPPAI